MAVQLQWRLDSSANSALSVARSIFQAALNDNVQQLAILACERFGNTIAMCPETCKKIDLLDVPNRGTDPRPLPRRAHRLFAAGRGFPAEQESGGCQVSQPRGCHGDIYEPL